MGVDKRVPQQKRRIAEPAGSLCGRAVTVDGFGESRRSVGNVPFTCLILEDRRKKTLTTQDPMRSPCARGSICPVLEGRPEMHMQCDAASAVWHFRIQKIERFGCDDNRAPLEQTAGACNVGTGGPVRGRVRLLALRGESRGGRVRGEADLAMDLRALADVVELVRLQPDARPRLLACFAPQVAARTGVNVTGHGPTGGRHC